MLEYPTHPTVYISPPTRGLDPQWGTSRDSDWRVGPGSGARGPDRGGEGQRLAVWVPRGSGRAHGRAPRVANESIERRRESRPFSLGAATREPAARDPASERTGAPERRRSPSPETGELPALSRSFLASAPRLRTAASRENEIDENGDAVGGTRIRSTRPQPELYRTIYAKEAHSQSRRYVCVLYSYLTHDTRLTASLPTTPQSSTVVEEEDGLDLLSMPHVDERIASRIRSPAL